MCKTENLSTLETFEALKLKFGFPLQDNSKEPPKGTRGHLDAPQPINEGQNWGLTLDHTDLIVLDVDVKHDFDGHESIKEEGHMIPETLSVSTPSGGRHYYYLKRSTHAACRSQHALDNVDILSRGYVVGPGSEVGGTYEVYHEKPIADAPEWLLKLNAPKAAAEVACDELHKIDLDLEKPATPEQIKDYLQNVAPIAIEGQSGHTTLLEVARSLYWGFKLSPDDCECALWEWYNQRCNPPWEETGSSKRQFAHKVREVAKDECIRGAGFLLEMSDSQRAWIEEFIRGMVERSEAKEATDPPFEIEQRDNSDPGIKPDLCASGLLKDLYDWIESRANISRPVLSEGVALCIMSILIGRKFRVYGKKANTRANLYFMALCPSGGGKENGLECIRLIMAAISRENCLLANFNSASTAEKILKSHGELAIVTDEAGDMLAANKSGAKGNKQLAELGGMIKTLWSASSSSLYLGTTMAPKDDGDVHRTIINYPYTVRYGASTPGAFTDALDGGDIEGGSLARILFLVDEEKKTAEFEEDDEEDASEVQGLPARVQSSLEKIQHFDEFQASEVLKRGEVFESAPIDPAFLGLLEAKRKNSPEPFEVRPDVEARRHLEERKSALYIGDEGEAEEAFWGRLSEMSMRIALILSISDVIEEGKELTQARITLKNAQDACAWVEHNTRVKLKVVKNRVGLSKADQAANKLLDKLEAAGSDGIAFEGIRSLCQGTPLVKADQRERVIEGLIKDQAIRVEGEGVTKRKFFIA